MMTKVVSSLDLLASAIRDSAKDLAVAALAEHLLPGIEVRLYQARDHSWCASVLLDPDLHPAPPARGNRPLVDSGSHRWWYDLAVGLVDYTKPVGSARERTASSARRQLDSDVADLLVEILQARLRGEVRAFVKALPHEASALAAG
jgi:hypothetical protein